MSIRQVRFQSGTIVPVYATLRSGLPDPYVAAYVVGDLIRRKAHRTVLNDLRGISLGLAFCAKLNINTAERCLTGIYLNDGEMRRLARHYEEKCEGGLRVAARAGYTAFTNFLIWLGKLIDPRAEPERQVALSHFKLDVETHRPPSAHQKSEPVLGLDEHQRTLFLSVIIPTHPRNPFGRMAYRNFVFMSVSYVFGLRTGEMLGLKVEDVTLNLVPATLRVEVRDDDPEDTRAERAAQKTVGRLLELRPEFADAFKVLKEERSQFAAARRHKYLFVNHRGQPLSSRGARRQYQMLRDAVPELAGLINHRCRHDWNDRFDEMCDERGWDREEAFRQQCYLQGWSTGSSMRNYYAKKSLAKKANALSLETQAAVLNGTRKQPGQQPKATKAGRSLMSNSPARTSRPIRNDTN